MTIEAKIIAIKRKIKEGGFIYTIKIIINRVQRYFNRTSLLFGVDLPTYSLKISDIWDKFEGKSISKMSHLSAGEIEAIQNYTGNKYITEMENRFADKWVLFLAFIDNQIAGAIWGVSNNTKFKTKAVPLFQGDIALIDNWTIPEHRGKGIHPFLLCYSANCYKLDGCKRAFGSVNTLNIASKKGFIKAGFNHYINYQAYKLFSKEIVLWKPI